jgi:hypothetical protein
MGRATARSDEATTSTTTHGSTPAAQSSAPALPQAARFATGSHADLFAEASVRRCDICSVVLDAAKDDEHGTGVYVWVRGDEVRREEAPLCAACGGSIIASAFGMIDFDDEE